MSERSAAEAVRNEAVRLCGVFGLGLDRMKVRSLIVALRAIPLPAEETEEMTERGAVAVAAAFRNDWATMLEQGHTEVRTDFLVEVLRCFRRLPLPLPSTDPIEDRPVSTKPQRGGLPPLETELALVRRALNIACRRGCDHCADDIREARAALKETLP